MTAPGRVYCLDDGAPLSEGLIRGIDSEAEVVRDSFPEHAAFEGKRPWSIELSVLVRQL